MLSDDKDVYRSTLEINDITTVYVAKYYCIHTEVVGEIKKTNFDYSNEVNTLKASSIYIYVDGMLIGHDQMSFSNCNNFLDPDVLLVQVDDIFINAYQNQNFTVPCKPTSKSVSVKLMHENEEVNTVQDDEIGFLFYENVIGHFSVELKCIGRYLNSRQQKLTFIVHTNVDDECNFHNFF